ncbi:MAG: TIGR01777 family protein [Armatimonadetes bacterium]|nr:TIGR01777 family protein [Armatimonadota bacterium]
MRIALTGSTGLIGRALAAEFAVWGHGVTAITRRARTGAVAWDPAGRSIEADKLEGHDAVVHLAGASIAGGRWTAARKRELWDSRVSATAFLSETLARLDRPPALLLCASAVGYYGDRAPDEQLTEDSRPGSDYLATMCQAWEGASDPLRAAGTRVAHLRFGNVLSRDGGFLGALLPLHRLGLGGRVGSGRQALSWISIDDVTGGVSHLLARADTAGAYNFTAPECASNARFTKTLARVLRRPAVFAVPAVAIRLAFGEMGEALLLSGQCVVPSRLRAAGYRFRYDTLEAALRAIV